MKTWQMLASAVVGISLIASATVPRATPAPAPVAVSNPAGAEAFTPTMPSEAQRDAATQAVLAEQRKAMIAEARARLLAPPQDPAPATAP